ncbi:MAG: TrkA C-terminal domain-containing protein [Nanoarchaeota archaeon]|nr:TrkA C-terminal domain-containing protein [Nanoarchaeota archaeon]
MVKKMLTARFEIFEHCSITDKTVKAVSEKYNVRITQLTRGPNYENPPLDKILQPKDFIEVLGTFEDVINLYKAASC